MEQAGKIVVTGAGSSVGPGLLSRLAALPGAEVVAAARSRRALEALPASPRIRPALVSYRDRHSLARLFEGTRRVVHLAGILIESRRSKYAEANEAAAAVVAAAAARAGAEHLIFVSALGADPASPNAYFRSKGRAERAVAGSGVAASILRTPILLGPGTAGGRALRAAAGGRRVRLLGGGRHLQRPLDADDLCEAVLALCRTRPTGASTYELAGPETLSHRNLVVRAAAAAGRTVSIGAAPLWLAKLGAALGGALRGGGVTPTVLEVITADEIVDANADAALGLSLTPLDATLKKIVAPEEPP